jgi:hypothetical protein
MLLHDYYYRIQDQRLHMPGRCRVRVFERKNGTHTVVLTELETNTGESVSSSCERIASDLVVVKSLNPNTTRWIQHQSPQNDLPQVFDEIQFTWSGNNKAGAPEWQRLSHEQAETVTGASLRELGQPYGESDAQTREPADDA